MDTNKLTDKLENFFDLSKKKQRKKHDKLLKIIRKLDKKKSTLEQKLQEEKETDATSSRYQDLERELLVISKLISKAKQKDLAD
jgi:phage-related minor tail protein